MDSNTRSTQHATSNSKDKKRKRDVGDPKELVGGKTAEQKQNDEFFYQTLHEYKTINVATVEASDLLRAFRQWPDHLQLSIPVHVTTAIKQLSTINDCELIGRYWQAREMRIEAIVEPLSPANLSKALSRGDNTKLSMLRTSRAIRTWLLLKHDTAMLLGEPRRVFERSLAKHLLDCCLLFLLKWQRAANVPQIPALEHILNETLDFLLENVPSGTEDDASSQAWAVSSQQGPLQTSLSQHDQKAHKNDKATISADPIDLPKSDLELVEPLIHRSKATLQEMACYSGQTAALNQVRYAAELPRLLQVPAYMKTMKKMDGILLHGPPGTGKTLIARVLASQAGITMFNASPSQIMSRYVGDGEKMVRALFTVAALKAPSMILLDEIDGLLADTTSEQDGASNKVKAQFLASWSCCQDERSDVLVVGTTNRPWALDIGIISRFQSVIYIPLPTAQDVKSILQSNMKDVYHGLKDGDFDALACLACGMSARSIVKIGTATFWLAQEKILGASYFHTEIIRNKTYWVPCAANDPNAKRCDYTAFEKSEMHHPKVTMADMKKTVLKSKESLDTPVLKIKEHEAFARSHGNGN